MTIIANWKSHKNNSQVREFFDEFAKFLFEKNPTHNIIISPSFPSIQYATDFTRANDLKIEIAAQNVSSEEEGAFTGEVAASQLKNIATYAIIGHSERRRHFGETEEIVAKKITLTKNSGLKTILCLQNEDETVGDVDYIAFEPPEAIGSGNPDDPKHIEKVFEKIKSKNTNAKLLYGGSINEENVKSFLNIPNLEGFLIGGASLEAESFANIISKC